MKNIPKGRLRLSGRAVAALSGLCLLCSSLSGCGTEPVHVPTVDELEARIQHSEDELSYAVYQQSCVYDDQASGAVIELLAEPLQLIAEQSLSVSFTVETEGMYRLRASLTGGTQVLSAYEAALTLDGQIPFAESEQLYFPKSWLSAEEYDYSHQPELVEATDYTSLAHSDKSYESEELYYHLTAGTHTIVLTAKNQGMDLQQLAFEGYEPPAGITGTPETTQAESILVQAENPASRSESSILEQIDRTSAATMPVCQDIATYNTIGGTSWQTLGESITWEFPVEEAGWYCLNLRARQDYSAGAVSCRRLLIDGRVWSDETDEITIPYGADWQRVTVSGGDGQTVWFYLEPGPHTVTLSCSLGSLYVPVTLIQESVAECNRIYRRILMITGTDPDAWRDYHLAERLPDVFEDMAVQRETLEAVASYLEALGQGGGSDAAVFRKLIRQFEEFEADPDSIPLQISTLNSNISAIGTWLLERTAQPLELDWLELQPYGAEATPVDSGFFSQMWHSLVRICRSYVESYDDLSGQDTARTVDVWAVTGRDQAQIIRNLSSESFTAATGIGANIKLISADSIMAATVAGIGPDVTLFNTSDTVISYALRSAITDLSKLEGFEEAAADFHESALIPYRFNGGVWALPETQSFPMLFYRQDILDELGIAVPTTWDEVYSCITTLQKNNMTFGCCGYDVLLYQQGGSYYTQDGASSLLDSEESVEAFRQWTKFYTNFGLPLSYNFINRFRTGEMPLAVADYSSYNSLVVFAPEISGSWGMTMVPGTVREDGTVDYSVSCAGTAAMLFAGAGDVDAAWSYLKWWVSGDTQTDYALSLETKLGASARVMVASKSAFESLPWTAQEKETIRAQWEWTVGTPEVAGGYLVTRHINNAFRRIVYQDADIRETLSEYARIIDKELTLKRQEYGLE